MKSGLEKQLILREKNSSDRKLSEIRNHRGHREVVSHFSSAEERAINQESISSINIFQEWVKKIKIFSDERKLRECVTSRPKRMPKGGSLHKKQTNKTQIKEETLEYQVAGYKISIPKIIFLYTSHKHIDLNLK